MKKSNLSTTSPSVVFRKALLSLFLLTLFAVSCQKEEDRLKVLSPQNISRVYDRTSLDTKVVTFTQWVITNLIPIIKDNQLVADITSGNLSPALNAKLLSLGYSSLDEFALQFYSVKSAIDLAYTEEGLTDSQFQKILHDNLNLIDFSSLYPEVLAESTGLPCTENFVACMSTLVPVASGAAFIAGGPLAELSAFVVASLGCYFNFRMCLTSQYPNGG